MTGMGKFLRRLRAATAVRVVLALLLVLICAACGSGTQPEVTYKPDFLPVELSLSKSGISITGDQSLATPIGTFSLGAQYSLPQASSNTIYVILRNRKTGYDHIFKVNSGSGDFTAVVNGTTSITVTHNQVIIDVSSGTIKKVAFKRAAPAIAEQGSGGNWFGKQWDHLATHWDQGWKQSWYKPYGLTRWAYSDSTISRWYGVGFVWFLLRLILAVIMCIVDTVLSLGFLVGQLFFIIFGPTGRDIIYGLMILAVLAFGALGAAA